MLLQHYKRLSVFLARALYYNLYSVYLTCILCIISTVCFERWWLIIGKVLCGTSGGLVEQYFRALVAPVPSVCVRLLCYKSLSACQTSQQSTDCLRHRHCHLHYVTLLIIHILGPCTIVYSFSVFILTTTQTRQAVNETSHCYGMR